jgi:hypothetical protein
VWQSEIAHHMALLPVALLSGLSVRHHRRDAAWWFLAGAFAISWVADTVADFLLPADRVVPSLVYPVSQSALVVAVLMPRLVALLLLGLMVGTGCLVVLQHGITTPDIALRSVAWPAVACVAWMRKELPVPLRACLLVYFGLGWVAWLVHVEWLTVATWYPYQLIRLLGLLLFCWAAVETGPHLRVMRRAA